MRYCYVQIKITENEWQELGQLGAYGNSQPDKVAENIVRNFLRERWLESKKSKEVNRVK